MNYQEQLDQNFHLIRNRYFPRWDRANRWYTCVGSFTGSSMELGHCDWVGHRIFISPRMIEDLDELPALLVHEICHAVTWAGHCPTFFKQMQRVIDQAGAEGEDHLAFKLELDLDYLERAKPLRAHHVYKLVGFFVDNAEHPTFEGLTRALHQLLLPAVRKRSVLAESAGLHRRRGKSE